MAAHGGGPTRQEVLDLALELAAQDEAKRLKEVEREELAVAAGEAGLDPQYIAAAEAELARRARVDAVLAAEQGAARRQRARWMGVFGVAAAVLVAGAWALTPEAPPPEGALAPWAFTFDDAAGWGLDKNPATHAVVTWPSDGGHGGVARIVVEEFGTSDGQKHRVNLDGAVLPDDVWGYRSLAIAARGTLPTARVYVEHGQDERWRSPPMALTPDWSTYRFDLLDFTHQHKQDGKWRDASPSLVRDADTVSIKLGDYMNDVGDAGWVEVDDLELR